MYTQSLSQTLFKICSCIQIPLLLLLQFLSVANKNPLNIYNLLKEWPCKLCKLSFSQEIYLIKNPSLVCILVPCCIIKPQLHTGTGHKIMENGALALLCIFWRKKTLAKFIYNSHLNSHFLLSKSVNSFTSGVESTVFLWY